MRLTYEEFKEEIMRKLEEIYKGDKQLMLQKVMKSNIGETESLTIRGNDNVSPNFYIQEMYKDYIAGNYDVSALVNMMVDKCNSAIKDKEKFDIEGIDSYEKVKDKIIYKIINTEMNEDFISESPHFDFLDLSMVFYIVVFNDAEGMGSIKVTNQMLNRWKISEETLKTDAQVNTPLLQPAKICTLGHMICKLMGDKNMEQDSEELGFDIREALEESNQIVLTNISGINGFGAILYDNCLYYIAERYGVEKLHLSCSNTKSYTTCLQAYIL